MRRGLRTKAGMIPYIGPQSPSPKPIKTTMIKSKGLGGGGDQAVISTSMGMGGAHRVKKVMGVNANIQYLIQTEHVIILYFGCSLLYESNQYI